MRRVKALASAIYGAVDLACNDLEYNEENELIIESLREAQALCEILQEESEDWRPFKWLDDDEEA